MNYIAGIGIFLFCYVNYIVCKCLKFDFLGPTESFDFFHKYPYPYHTAAARLAAQPWKCEMREDCTKLGVFGRYVDFGGDLDFFFFKPS